MAIEEKTTEELQKMTTPQLLERKAQLNKEIKKAFIVNIRDIGWGFAVPVYSYVAIMHYLLGQTFVGVVGAYIYLLGLIFFIRHKRKQARTKEYQDLLALCKPVKGKHQR